MPRRHLLRMPAAVAGLFLLGFLLEWLHPLGQAGAYHAFANTRTWLGVPNAADVLSNVPIFLAGCAILAKVGRSPEVDAASAPGLVVAGVGLVVTGIGSAWYHLAPSDATLIWDRLPLAVVFAGVLLTAWASSGIAPPSKAEAALFVLASLGSVGWWVFLGSLWPYAILQFGGLAAILVLAVRNRLVPAGAWWLLLLLYALAKACEMLDQAIWDWTHQVVSGHTLKHLMSAAAGSCLLWAASRGGAAVPARKETKGPSHVIVPSSRKPG